MREVSRSLLGLAALALVATATPASALTIGPNFCLPGSTGGDCKMQLDIGNPGGSGISGYPAPYVGIDVTIKGDNTLEFALKGLTTGSYHYYFNDLALDLLGGTFSGTFGSATGAFGNTRLSNTFTFGTSLPEDGFGSGAPGNKFGDVSIDGGSGFPDSLQNLVFDITFGTMPGSLTTFTDLLTQQFMDLSEHGGNTQGGGASAAGHVFVINATDLTGDTQFTSRTVEAVKTGYAAWPNCADQRVTDCVVVDPRCTDNCTVPEPASLALLGSALVGVAVVNRRRRRQTLV